MKKLLILVINIFVTGILFAQDLTPDQIVSNYLKAIGQDKFMNIETMKMTGKMNIPQQGLDMQVTQFQKKPDKVRQDIEVQGMTVVMSTYGETGWVINPMMGATEPQYLNAEAIKALEKEGNNDPTADWDTPFINSKEKGINIEFAGKEDINGSTALNLKFTYKEGYSINYLFDANSFLLLKSKSTENVQGQTYDREIRFSDYRNFNGILFPGKLDMLVNGQVQQVFTLTNCEFNIPVDDSIFNKPVKN